MNEFEKRIKALRFQFRDESVRISKDCSRTIGHLNTAIGQVSNTEAREALRAEKARVYEAMLNSIEYNRLCYIQQLEAIEEEARLHFEKTPSRRQIRHALRTLRRYAQEKGESSVSMAIGKDIRCTVNFDDFSKISKELIGQ